MIWIFTGIVIVAIAAIFLVKLSQNRAIESAEYPFQKTDVLFSPAERSFYGVLRQAVAGNALVFGKIRVADVVVPKKGLSRSEWQKSFNKISGKHFDFMLCNSDDLSVICAIELDDSSHQVKNRQKRDAFLNGVCMAAGVPLIQVPAKSGYVIEEIKQLLAPHLNINELPSQKTEGAPQESVINEKLCPKCSSPMVLRVAKKGANAGKHFWTCSAYPKCKNIEAVNG